MGDHRASVKIEFEFHGKTHKMDSWINWSPSCSECEGVDQRVIDFFRKGTEEGMTEWYEAVAEDERRNHEKAERDEYERLKAKFAPPPAVQSSEQEKG